MNLFQTIARGSSRHNVNNTERWLSVAGGALALAYGMKRGRRGRWPALVAGASLLQRGTTGSCALYHALGVNTCRNASHHHDALPATETRAVPEASTARS